MSNKQNQDRQQSDPGSRRQQLRFEQERAAKEQRVRKVVSYIALGVGAVALIAGLAWAAISSGAFAPKPAGVGVNADYTVMAGKVDAPVVVDVYQDFICPYCGDFERANSADLVALVSSGQAAVRIHPMNFLDDASQGTKYSSRAANALVTTAKAEPDKMLAMNAALYSQQPEEGTPGLTDAEIATLAQQAGVSQATIDSFAKLSYVGFANSSTAAAFTDGIERTPTVLINGKPFTGNILTSGPLKDAVAAAAKK